MADYIEFMQLYTLQAIWKIMNRNKLDIRNSKKSNKDKEEVFLEIYGG